jgi:hypothetical protein
MLQQLSQNKQQLKAQGMIIVSALEGLLINSIPALVLAALIAACIYPEITLAANLEQQLDKVGTVANGKFKTIGLTAATIGGAIWSVVKGNIKLTGIIIAIGISMSLYLEWIKDGMVLTA